MARGTNTEIQKADDRSFCQVKPDYGYSTLYCSVQEQARVMVRKYNIPDIFSPFIFETRGCTLEDVSGTMRKAPMLIVIGRTAGVEVIIMQQCIMQCNALQGRCSGGCTQLNTYDHLTINLK